MALRRKRWRCCELKGRWRPMWRCGSRNELEGEAGGSVAFGTGESPGEKARTGAKKGGWIGGHGRAKRALRRRLVLGGGV